MTRSIHCRCGAIKPPQAAYCRTCARTLELVKCEESETEGT